MVYTYGTHQLISPAAAAIPKLFFGICPVAHLFCMEHTKIHLRDRVQRRMIRFKRLLLGLNHMSGPLLWHYHGTSYLRWVGHKKFKRVFTRDELSPQLGTFRYWFPLQCCSQTWVLPISICSISESGYFCPSLASGSTFRYTKYAPQRGKHEYAIGAVRRGSVRIIRFHDDTSRNVKKSEKPPYKPKSDEHQFGGYCACGHY